MPKVKENLIPDHVFVNNQRKEAARWTYEIVALDGKSVGATSHTINDLASAGWEPCMMSSSAILLRRDATGAVHEEATRPRADLLKKIENIR